MVSTIEARTYAVVAAKISIRRAVDTAARMREKNTLNPRITKSLVSGFDRKYRISIEMLGSMDASSMLIALAMLFSVFLSYCQMPYHSELVVGCCR